MRSPSRLLIAGLALFAVVRVCVSALAFPLFGHIDELAHVDMVVKYSRQVSLPEARIGRDVLEVFVLHNSPEYWLEPGPDGVKKLPSQFELTPEQRQAHVENEVAKLGHARNNELAEGPVYYWIAGTWWRLGRGLGLDFVASIYWTRMLGAVALGIAILLAAGIARRVASDRAFVTLGVPLLMAVWPQDIFCFVTNDGFNVLLGTFALWCLFRIRRETEPRASIAAYALAGAAIGIALTSKPNNLVIALAAPMLLWSTVRGFAAHRDARVRLVTLALVALAPVATWSLVLHSQTGHWVGTTHKTEVLGIAPNTFAGMLAHPIWSLEGQWIFWNELIASSWRGETYWHGSVMRTVWGDGIMVAVTVLAVSTCGYAIVRRRIRLDRTVAVAAVTATGLATAAQFWASFAYDWGNNAYPSADYPYAVSGRLNTPIVVLFSLGFLEGLDRLASGFGPRAKWLALSCVVATLLGSELSVMIPVLMSPHSFWHLNG